MLYKVTLQILAYGHARLSLLMLAGALTLACADLEAPLGPVSFDTASFEMGLDALDEALDTDDWVSFSYLGESFLLTTSAPAPVGRSETATLTALTPIISDAFLGSTLVYDGEKYIVDPERSDAPADGVRFILYRIDPADSLPLLSTELAYADVRDLGAELTAGFEVSVDVVASSGVVAEYLGSFQLAEAAAATSAITLFDHDALKLAGHVTDGSVDIVFELVTGTLDGVLTTDVELHVGETDLMIEGVLGLNESTDELEVDFSVIAATDELRLIGRGDGGGFDGDILWNGDAVARVTSTDPVEVRALPGVELSERQRAVLQRVVDTIDLLLELTHHLTEPIELT